MKTLAINLQFIDTFKKHIWRLVTVRSGCRQKADWKDYWFFFLLFVCFQSGFQALDNEAHSETRKLKSTTKLCRTSVLRELICYNWLRKHFFFFSKRIEHLVSYVKKNTHNQLSQEIRNNSQKDIPTIFWFPLLEVKFKEAGNTSTALIFCLS